MVPFRHLYVSLLLIIMSASFFVTPLRATLSIDISQEFTDGIYVMKDQWGYNDNFYGAWVNASGVEMLYLSALSWSTLNWFAGFHYKTVNGSNLFVGNTFSAFEVFNDANHNGIVDASTSPGGANEVERYLANFTVHSYNLHRMQKAQIDSLPHYRWGISYTGEALGMPTNGCMGSSGCNMSQIIFYRFSNLTFDYDFYADAAKAHLKMSFQLIPLGTYPQFDGRSLAAGYAATVLVVSQTGSPGSCQTQINRQQGLYSLCAGSKPSIGGALNGTTIQVGNGTVFQYSFGSDYTLGQNNVNSTHTSTASIAGPSDLAPAVNSPEAMISMGNMERSAREYASLVIPDANQLNLTYTYATMLYRISYPVWNGGAIWHDPELIAYRVAVIGGAPPSTQPPASTPTSNFWLQSPYLYYWLTGIVGAIVAVTYLIIRRNRVSLAGTP